MSRPSIFIGDRVRVNSTLDGYVTAVRGWKEIGAGYSPEEMYDVVARMRAQYGAEFWKTYWEISVRLDTGMDVVVEHRKVHVLESRGSK